MGLKVSGPNLEAIERAGLALEAALKEAPSIKSETVFYDRSVGAPYIEIHLNRSEMARYGINVQDVQEIISVAVGGMAEVNAVEMAKAHLQEIMDNGVSYKFAGTYEQQHAARTLMVIIPLAFLAIFIILFMQFKTFTASCIHFSGVFVAFAGGFMMIWLYGQPWFSIFSSFYIPPHANPKRVRKSEAWQTCQNA
jgi:Cu/Ag efflux pump CusA